MSSFIGPGNYIIVNADEATGKGMYLSFETVSKSILSHGPFFTLKANSLNLNGSKAVQWRVNYRPTTSSGSRLTTQDAAPEGEQGQANDFHLKCVWMGPSGKGHSNFGKVVTLGSIQNNLRLVSERPPSFFRAAAVPETSDEFFLQVVDAEHDVKKKASSEAKPKFVYAQGQHVTLHASLKSSWKFIYLGPIE